MNSNEIVLKSKKHINKETYFTLSKYLGRGQVTFVDPNSLGLKEVEVLTGFTYNLKVKDTFDDSDVSFLFNVFMLEDGVHILYIKHDFHYYIEVKETLEGVKERYNWFIKMMIEFHQDVLISKRGSY